ncbi:MAG: thioredoxin family protein [Acetobacter sp.]|nr:thioredoxin family protein [Acetobacter sp.]
MENIKILGTGCPKCKETMKIVEKAAKANGFSGKIEKVEDIAAIISYGVMSTPAVVIDGKVAFAGGIPSEEQANSWFQKNGCSCGCCQ